MDLLIDADILVFKIGFISEDKTEQEARQLMDDYIGNFTDYLLTFLVPHEEYTGSKFYLTGKESFRKEVDPEYKKNRKDKPKPKHVEMLRQYLVDKYGAVIAKNGYECDDCLGYEQTKALNRP